MDAQALDQHITGNYGNDQFQTDPQEDLLYGRMYAALTNYVNHVKPAANDDEQDALDDLITDVLDILIERTDR